MKRIAVVTLCVFAVLSGLLALGLRVWSSSMHALFRNVLATAGGQSPSELLPQSTQRLLGCPLWPLGGTIVFLAAAVLTAKDKCSTRLAVSILIACLALSIGILVWSMLDTTLNLTPLIAPLSESN